uniref:Uncharacterized protein n=1 Tax=Fagus sylvatica TaxID=28930 RepID=A0A2N9IYG8_FAGSY
MSSTSRHEITHPITTVLDGPASYHTWSQNMIVFLKGHRLWHYVTGDIPKPVPRPITDSDSSDDDFGADIVIPIDDFEARLKEWESIQCKILSWFINTFVPAISSLLPRLEIGQAAWSFLATHYNCTYDFALEFHIELKLYQMRQDSGQSISDYYSQIASMWEQLAAADPPLNCPPFPSLDAAVKELIFEENRRPHHHLSSSDVVLATPHPPASSSDRLRRIYKYCKKPSHDISECYHKQKDDKRKHHQSRGLLPRSQGSRFTPGNKSWLLDSACCNHMTPHASHFSQKAPLAPSLIIYTTDSSHMSVSHIGTVSSPDLTIPDTYLVPKLSLNLLYVGQLCELGLDLHFSNRGVDMQDPLTSKLLGTGRKIGRLFELCNLQIPSHMVSSFVAATTTLSPDLWHSCLGHASLSRLQLLASQGHLESLLAHLASDPAPSAPSESPTNLRRSTQARLVAGGFTQEYGIDYEETFAHVARLTSIRSLLAVAASTCSHLLATLILRVKFVAFTVLSMVLSKLLGPGLLSFSSVVAQQGFTPSSYDSALFIRHTSTSITLILLYVDDMIIIGDDTASIRDLQKFLSQHFEMKDLGTLSYFLRLEVTSSFDGYYLFQAKYAFDLLSKAVLTDSKIVSTPLELNVKLNTTDGEPLSDATLYRQLVGSLINLTVTRPDLAYAVHLVSQFLSALCSTHYAAVLRAAVLCILRYIKGMLFHGLHFLAQSSLKLRAYADADRAGDSTDRHSTTGYCFLLDSSLISWCSKKQSVVARSNTEAEYRALADATSELLWLRWLLTDMGASQTTSTPIHCDNHNAIHIAHNDVFYECTKHIEIDCHFIRHHLQQSALHLLSISSKDQLADVFTKSYPPGCLRDLVFKLKMASSSPPCV